MSHDEEDSEAAFKPTTPFDKYAGNSRPAPPATGGGLIGPSMAIFTLSLRNVQSHTSCRPVTVEEKFRTAGSSG
jgi:hypothetical protein